MSKRTADANKAIEAAWAEEQKRVEKGTGTRDWTPQQQKDILDRGKAYDEDGKAFEGQHMRSVEIHPEEQGNPDNIQFLSRKEHLAAHDGNWRNPTNWYYDPITQIKTDFGDGPVIPCAVIQLSQPVEVIENQCDSPNKHDDNSQVNETDNCRNNAFQENPNTSADSESTSSDLISSTPVPTEKPPTPFLKQAWNVLAKGVTFAADFSEKHPFLTAIGVFAINAIIETVSNNRSNSEDGYSYDSDNDDSDCTTNNTYDSSETTETNSKDYPETHASPQEHTVPAHGQHYHTKNGVIWKEKEPYSRGKKNTDEDSD